MIVDFADDDVVAGLAPDPSKTQTYYWDKTLPGFGCRVSAKGRRMFIMRYRVGTGSKKIVIGPHTSWSVAEARAKAFALTTGGNAAPIDIEPIRPEDEPVAVRIVAVYANGAEHTVTQQPLYRSGDYQDITARLNNEEWGLLLHREAKP